MVAPLTPGSRSAANAVLHVIFYSLTTVAIETFYAGVIRSYHFWKQDFYTSYNVLNVYIVSICVFFLRAHFNNLEPHSFVCSAPLSLVSNVFFFLVSFQHCNLGESDQINNWFLYNLQGQVLYPEPTKPNAFHLFSHIQTYF